MDDPPQPPPPGGEAPEVEIPPLGEAHVPRYLIDRHDVVIGLVDAEPMFRAYFDHAKRWERAPDPLGCVMMRQALAGACLYLSGLHNKESVAWTINLKEPATNLFVAGDVIDGHVTARLFTEAVATVESSRLFCQTQIPGAPVRETVIDVEGLDVLMLLESFCRRSDQNNARFFDYDDGRSAIVSPLPGADEEWLLGLDRDAALALVGPTTPLLETRVFSFACGCSQAKMLEVIESVYGGRYDELFQGEPGVEVQCPRCGHEWLLSRADFD